MLGRADGKFHPWQIATEYEVAVVAQRAGALNPILSQYYRLPAKKDWVLTYMFPNCGVKNPGKPVYRFQLAIMAARWAQNPNHQFGVRPVPKQKPAPPKPVYSGTGVERWRPLVAKYFPASQVNNGLRCITRESRGDPNAIGGPNRNGTYDYGLFQINKGLQTYGSKIYDPEFNVRVAYGMWRNRGWQPWSATMRGYY